MDVAGLTARFPPAGKFVMELGHRVLGLFVIELGKSVVFAVGLICRFEEHPAEGKIQPHVFPSTISQTASSLAIQNVPLNEGR